MVTQVGDFRKRYMANKLRSISSGKKVNVEENVIEWNTLFRRNWDIYAEFFLGIPLMPYQRQALHEIGVSDVYFWRAARNGAKSFVTSIAAICKLLLYPNCWVTVTASTAAQANRIVEDKILKELIKKLSPYLLYMYEKQWLIIRKPGDGYIVENTLNNSTLQVLAAVEGSRGARSNFNIQDEIAVMKKSTLDEIFEGMLFPRQPAYFSNPEYRNNPRWLEESKSVYLTSSKFKYMWWYRTWTDCVTGYYTDKKTKYGVFATDFFDNIANGLKTWGDYRRAKRTIDDYSFRMEYLNEAIGESEDAFFTLKSFKENQTLKKHWQPPNDFDILLGRNLGNAKKQDTEIRIVVTDYAFANTTSNQENDNTIILCMSLHWKKGGYFERHVDYIEGWPASDSLGASERAKIIFNDYQADYFVPDLQSGGETLHNHTTEKLSLPNRGVNSEIKGFTIANEKYLHVLPEAKLGELRQRAVDPDAIPCVVPIKGNIGLNSEMWVELKKQLEVNNIKFLKDAREKQEELEDSGEYFTLSADEIADKLLPYGQTELLIKEATELQAEIREGRVRLAEPRSGTKDRAVCLSYGNYIASKIENKWLQVMASEDVDDEDIQLVF